MSDALREEIEQLRIRNACVDSYNTYASSLDGKDWPKVRGCFADEVYIDYGDISASTGDPKVPRKADDWCEILQGVINGFDITRHAITNHRVHVVDGNVSCSAYLSADHVVFSDPAVPIAGAEDVVTVVGEYTNHYVEIDGQWKIWKSELAVDWSSGNMALFPTALERSAALKDGA
ncbi:MAG: nuclear transport factor 2 family protein [Halioglobus sp.]